MTQSGYSKNPNDEEPESDFPALSEDEQLAMRILESIAGPKGTESPDPRPELVNSEPIIAAGDEGDDTAAPEQPLDERETKIPRPIVSVNGKDVEKSDEPEEKKKAA